MRLRHPISYRTRLIVMITLLVGVVLTVFALVVWQITRQSLRERFDLTLQMAARDAVPMLRGGPPYQAGPGRGTGGMRRGRRGPPPEQAEQAREQARGRLEQVQVQWIYLRQGEVELISEGFPADEISPRVLQEWIEHHAGQARPLPQHAEPSPGSPRPPFQGGVGPAEPGFPPPETAFDWPKSQPRYRVLLLPERGGVWVFVRPLRLLQAEIAVLSNSFLLGIPAALGLVALGAWFVAGRAVKPVNRLASAAEAVTAEDLSARLSPLGEDQEFAQLIVIFNSMLHRLETSFNQARRFSADAAHELNTPLAILMGHLDTALQEAETGSQQQQQIQLLLEEVHRLRAIVDQLMILSRADSGVLKVEKKSVNLANILDEVYDEASAIAEDVGVEKDYPRELPLTADAGLLRQVFHNLLSNALKYNRPLGRVWVRARQEGGSLTVIVGNTGAAIPPEHVPQLFERFFRADPSRNRKVPGLGLGLSLAREFVLVHNGAIMLRTNDPDHIEIEVQLPKGS